MFVFTTVSVFKQEDMSIRPNTLHFLANRKAVLGLSTFSRSSQYLQCFWTIQSESPDLEDVWHESCGQCWSFSSRSSWKVWTWALPERHDGLICHRSKWTADLDRQWPCPIRRSPRSTVSLSLSLCWKWCRLKGSEEIQYDYCSKALQNEYSFCLRKIKCIFPSPFT